ncbi:MAG: cysteine--tRNA ligase [Sphingobacteriales bacterium]|nr:cysteine--tRNA ligase [Sphingobacteriales bacterium]
MKNKILVYNTLSGQKEPFSSIKKDEISMYVCGPTVYSNAHIGHALSAMVFDIIRRYFEHVGYSVKFIMNFTDVDDKIIIRSQKENIDATTLTENLINEYILQLKKLNIKPATHYPKATEEIGGMISFIEELVKKDFAYSVNGDVFYRTSKFITYGKLSGRKIDEQLSGTRIDVDNRKERVEDFALWKSAKKGEPSWESPWGNGRPGWHIECSSMCIHHLGEQIDIHGGGTDLIFPHHENEIAQSEAYTGKPFAKYWMHNGMLELKGGKMSKSVGNLITINEFLEKFDANTFRMMLISSHYRSPLAFNFDLAEESLRKVQKITSALKGAWGNNSDDYLAKEAESTAANFVLEFHNSMNDDFNTPIFLSHLFSITKYVNQLRDKGASDEILSIVQKEIKNVLKIIGFNIESITSTTSNNLEPQLIELLIEIRKELRNNKNWALSDTIRNKLSAIGVNLEDSPNGETGWTKL